MSKQENVLDTRYVPINDTSGRLEIFVQMSDEEHEVLGDMDEVIMVMAALQQLYMTAVTATTGEHVNTVLAGTLAALEKELATRADGEATT